jgi:hypothetical protein
MSISRAQANDFVDYILPSSQNTIADAITWIGDNLSPEDVFDHEKLVAWAEENDFEKGHFI